MKTIISTSLKLTFALMLVVAFFSAGLAPADRAFALCSPNQFFDLYAKSGTANLYGSVNVTFWGYSLTSGGNATLPGPVLTVSQGNCVQVTLHNDLAEASALNFPGQSLVPDTTGAAAGGTQTYTFQAASPGTFLYEAGLIPGKQHQVAMGLYGAFVVSSSASGTAYGTAATAFDQANILVLSEFDPTLAASPTSFDMRNYAPKYFLINGKAYASGFTGDIAVTAGQKILLRYVNAGLQSHAMATLGISQSVVAQGGRPFAHPHTMVGETIATGQTLDSLVAIPSTVVAGTRYAVYDANLMLRNSTASGLGGMLTFLNVGTGITPPATGPLTTGVTLTPGSTNGSVNVAVSASVSDVTTGGTNVDQAEFYIDNTSGIPTAMTGAFGSQTVAVSGTITTAVLSTLASGSHTVYVRGHDSAGWGPFSSASLNLDKVGPTTSALAASPNPTNGTVDVALSATASDVSTGNSNIAAAEYTIDGGAAIAMTVNLAAPTASLSATIPAATVSGLANGSHTISVRSQDAFGNWGAFATTSLAVDKTGPATSSVVASPNPNNGSKPFNTSTLAVRVTASFSDAATGNSNVVAAEGFLDTVAATGTGFAFIATDGTFNSTTETGYADIPLAVIGTLTAGSHTIYVHAKDATGNWGAMSTTILVIDKTAPTVLSISLAGANPTNAATVQFTVTFSESVTGGAVSNFTLAVTGLTGPAISSVTGSGATRTVTVSTGTSTNSGTLGLNLTSTAGIADLAGNTLSSTGIPFTGQTYTIDKTIPTFTSFTITPTSIVQGTASITMAITGSADSGGSGLANAGQYWFDTNAPTAFTGTSGIAVATGALSPGSHTLSVRIRDNAGNWSITQTTTLTVIPDAIFSDGFESPTTLPGNWSSASTNNTTRLNNTTSAALVGTRGLQAQGNNTNYVQYNFGTIASPVTATFDARFYFNPNNNASTGQDIFRAASGTSNTSFSTPLFSVRYRRNGTQPQVQIQVGATANAAWVNITNNASNYIEVVWQSGTSLQLYVNGTLGQTLTAGAGSVSAFRLGSVVSGGSSTLMYFDAFASKRQVSPLIGP